MICAFLQDRPINYEVLRIELHSSQSPLEQLFTVLLSGNSALFASPLKIHDGSVILLNIISLLPIKHLLGHHLEHSHQNLHLWCKNLKFS
jgi:hypothetical protein